MIIYLATGGANFGVFLIVAFQILKNVKMCNFYNQWLKFNNFLSFVSRLIQACQNLIQAYFLEIYRARISIFCLKIEIFYFEFPNIFTIWRKLRNFGNFQKKTDKMSISNLIVCFKSATTRVDEVSYGHCTSCHLQDFNLQHSVSNVRISYSSFFPTWNNVVFAKVESKL